MKFLRFDLRQGASISPGEQTDACACFRLPGLTLTNETEQQNLFPWKVFHRWVGGGPAGCEEREESGKTRNVLPPFGSFSACRITNNKCVRWSLLVSLRSTSTFSSRPPNFIRPPVRIQSAGIWPLKKMSQSAAAAGVCVCVCVSELCNFKHLNAEQTLIQLQI